MGGQLSRTSGISGYDLGLKFREHADRLGAQFAEDEVLNIRMEEKAQSRAWCAREIPMRPGPYTCHRSCTQEAGVPGEEELAGAGCPTVPPATGHFSAIRSRLSSEAAMWLWRMPFSCAYVQQGVSDSQEK